MATRNEEVKYSFTADNSTLVKTVTENISLLDNYGKYLTKFATNSLAATDKELKAISAQVTRVTSVASQMSRVFSDFQHQVDKFSTGFNWVDEAIRKQEKLAKSAKESADVFKQAYDDQNKNNAGKRGEVNVDASRSSAEESARVFQEAFEKQDNAISKFLLKFTDFDDVLSSSSVSIAAFGAKLSTVGAVMGTVTSLLKKALPIVLQITKAVTKFVMSPLKILQVGMKSLTDSFKAAKSAFSGFGSLFGVGAGASLGYALSEAAKDASDMAEAINLFNVVMKESREEGAQWVATLSEMSGMDMTNLMSITGLFYEMGAAVEMPHEAATKLSRDLTELSLDISSLFNTDIETVTSNLTSGIRGMSRAVVKYGMDVRASTVENYARSKLGIKEQYETMNETNKIILRYLVMLDQASDANSDYSRTIEQPANQLRVFKQQVLGLSREIGRFIVNVLDPMLPKINGLVMALRNITKFIADFLGIWSGVQETEDNDGNNDAADGIEGIGSAADDATKSLKRFLAPFDELNVLNKESSKDKGISDYGFADPRLLTALEEATTGFEQIKMKAHEARDAILEFFGFEYIFGEDGLEKFIQPIEGGFADRLITAFKNQDYSGVGKIIAEKLNPQISKLAEAFSWENIGDKVKRNLGALLDSINSFMVTLKWNTVGEVFGNLLKTTFETINFAMLNFNWTALGKAVADTLTGFFEAFDIKSVGETLAHVLESIADFAASFATEFKWDAFGTNLGNSINTFFNQWDAEKLGTAGSKVIKNLLTMINKAIDTTDWKLVGQKIAAFLQALDWQEILSMLGKTIWNALKAAVTASVTVQESFSQANPYLATTPGYVAPIVPVEKKFATGGVVTGPTRALIGEAGRAEMVMPLDNSPQMQQFISQIADAVRGNNSQPTEVHVYLDNKTLASSVYDELRNVEFRRGASLIV